MVFQPPVLGTVREPVTFCCRSRRGIPIGAGGGDAEIERVGAGGCDSEGVVEPFTGLGPADVVAAAGVGGGLDVDAGGAVDVAEVGFVDVVIGDAFDAAVEVFGLDGESSEEWCRRRGCWRGWGRR